ncbi:MAG: META domain-containing protein, partial [Ferruginibacter sp.]
TKDGDIKIFITNKECTTPIHKEVFTKEVKFSFNSITYNGCGNYLSNNNLHGKWKLEKLGNININTKDYNVAPFCNIDLNKNSITGNDGCNTFGGKIEVQGDRIKFGLLISTQMACGNKSIDQILAQQINNQLVNYYFKESKLYLYLPNDSILVFIKYE